MVKLTTRPNIHGQIPIYREIQKPENYQGDNLHLLTRYELCERIRYLERRLRELQQPKGEQLNEQNRITSSTGRNINISSR